MDDLIERMYVSNMSGIAVSILSRQGEAMSALTTTPPDQSPATPTRAATLVANGKVAQRLAGMVAELRSVVVGLDPNELLCGDAVAVLDQFVAIGRLADGGRIKVAARAQQSGQWRTNGDRSPAEWLAARAGSGVRQARDELATSEKVAVLPQVADALGRGELSAQQAVAVADGAAANPGRESDLLDTARKAGLGGLRREVDRVKQAAVIDEAAQQRLIHRTRHHRTWTQGGAHRSSTLMTVDAGVRMDTMLGPFRQAVFEAARRRGEREDAECYAADALVLAVEAGAAWLTGTPPPRMPTRHQSDRDDRDHDDRDEHHQPDRDRAGATARATGEGTRGQTVGTRDAAKAEATDGQPPDGPPGPAPGPPQTSTPAATSTLLADLIEHGELRPRGGNHLKTILRVDAAALDRGRTVEGEVCEVARLGPVPVPAARTLVADSALAVVLTRGNDVLRVVNLGRAPNALQTTVLQWRDPVCTVEGCTNAARLEVDHIDLWSEDGPTSLDNLEHKCAHHHRLKSRDGWTEAEGSAGQRRTLRPPNAPPSTGPPRGPADEPDPP